MHTHTHTHTHTHADTHTNTHTNNPHRDTHTWTTHASAHTQKQTNKNCTSTTAHQNHHAEQDCKLTLKAGTKSCESVTEPTFLTLASTADTAWTHLLTSTSSTTTSTCKLQGLTFSFHCSCTGHLQFSVYRCHAVWVSMGCKYPHPIAGITMWSSLSVCLVARLINCCVLFVLNDCNVTKTNSSAHFFMSLAKKYPSILVWSGQ